MGKININLNFSQIGEAFKKLSFLRSYSMLLVPLIIVIVSAGIFTTALLMGKNFRSQVTKQSIPIGQEIDNRLNNAISMGQVEAEKQYQQRFEQDAKAIEQKAIESSQREPLKYGIFPEPKELTSNLFTEFGRTFCEKINEKINRINGGDSPTDEEIRANVTKTVTGLRGQGMGSTSNADQIKEEICLQRARTIAIYINPADIAGYSFWEEYKYSKPEQALKDCWDWQIGYWITEDILETIDKINEGYRTVFDSPIKRLVYIGYTSPDKMITSSGGGGGRWKIAQDKPKCVKKADDMLAEPCTGRMSNTEIDVIQFSINVVAENDHILPFMKELCSVKEHTFSGYDGNEPPRKLIHNQITILQSNIRPINNEDLLHSNYRYGNKPTSEVELVCEYIFNKKGYEPINPSRPKVEQSPAAPG